MGLVELVGVARSELFRCFLVKEIGVSMALAFRDGESNHTCAIGEMCIGEMC